MTLRAVECVCVMDNHATTFYHWHAKMFKRSLEGKICETVLHLFKLAGYLKLRVTSGECKDVVLRNIV